MSQLKLKFWPNNLFSCISRMNMTVIQCETQRAPTLLGSGGRRRRKARQYIISVLIDGETMTHSEPFQYMPDSEVTEIYPGSTIHRSAHF